VINLYKRFVLWNCTLVSKVPIPGYRRYGQWLHRQYTKRFWTMWLINMAMSLGIAAWFRHLHNEIVREEQEHQRLNDDLSARLYSYMGGESMYASLHPEN